MCPLKDVGFGWTDLGPSPWYMPGAVAGGQGLCLWVVPLPMGTRCLSNCPSNAGLESGVVPSTLGMQNQHTLALRGGSCKKWESKASSSWTGWSQWFWVNLELVLKFPRQKGSVQQNILCSRWGGGSLKTTHPSWSLWMTTAWTDFFFLSVSIIYHCITNHPMTYSCKQK